MINLLNSCCILGGDFNAILSIKESGETWGIDIAFSDFLNDCNFLDLPLQNSDFTWFSPRYGGVWSILDM